MHDRSQDWRFWNSIPLSGDQNHLQIVLFISHGDLPAAGVAAGQPGITARTPLQGLLP
jgi:hypothetical protein